VSVLLRTLHANVERTAGGLWTRLSRASSEVWEGLAQVRWIFFMLFCIEISVVRLGIQILISWQANFEKLVLHLNISEEKRPCREGTNCWMLCAWRGRAQVCTVGRSGNAAALKERRGKQLAKSLEATLKLQHRGQISCALTYNVQRRSTVFRSCCTDFLTNQDYQCCV